MQSEFKSINKTWHTVTYGRTQYTAAAHTSLDLSFFKMLFCLAKYSHGGFYGFTLIELRLTAVCIHDECIDVE